MVDPVFVQRMARYNCWQNENLYGEADALSDAERRQDRGAFFGSIQGTLSHLMWGDRVWMSRFATMAAPQVPNSQSPTHYPDWGALKTERAALDASIIAWADTVSRAWLDADLTWYSGAANRELSYPRWFLVAHMFNHQTHHRGQVHCMLTQAGRRPRETDLFLMGP